MVISKWGSVEVGDCYRIPGDRRFYISGFSGDEGMGTCTVLLKDGTYAANIPIDGMNRVKIGKRWYGRDKWDH